MNIKQYLRSIILIALVSFSAMTQAEVIDVIKIGTWNVGPGSGNPTVSGGPGMAQGQKYVIKISYDDTSTVDTRDILTEGFADSGQDMSVIELTGGSNTLDIFVPMEGLPDNGDGSPFIYIQDESDHLSFGLNVDIPTVNFALGSVVSDKANIIGVEFEGNFVAGAGNNVIELYNTAADDTAPINQVGQVLNFGVGTAIRQIQETPLDPVGGSLTDAVAVTVTDDSVTFDSSMTAQSTNVTATGNDLGAGRSDGEDFLDDLDVSGTFVPPPVGDGIDIEVSMANSGLTNSGDSTTWNVTVDEQMTGLSGSGQVVVNYANAAPSSNLSASANATGYDFAYTSADADLVVNALITGFEILTYSVLVDGVATAFFDSLITTGSLSLTELALFNEFGAGLHTLSILVTDLAGAMSPSKAEFTVGAVSPIPIPSAFILMLTALGFLGATGFKRQRS